MTESKMKWALYLCISSYFPENHILEDVNKCVIALQEGDVDTLDRTAGAIRGRAARVIHIINAEMENYEKIYKDIGKDEKKNYSYLNFSFIKKLESRLISRM